MQKCPLSGNVSFPIRTVIKDISPHITKLLNKSPALSIECIERTQNPSFEDTRRFSGIIDEPSGAAELTYNDKSYRLFNMQLCLSTHTNWIPKKNATDLIQNKIDIIMLFEIVEPSNSPRFVFIVLPLIIDSTVTEDNLYLQGLTYNMSDMSFKLDYLLSGLTKFIYYNTCLEPTGDNAFVYVSIEGISMSQTLYNDLLAVWRNSTQSDIQESIENSNSGKILNIYDYLVKIKNIKDLHSNSRVINNYSKSLNPLIDNTYENWPSYFPPYNIKINLTNRYITDSMLNLQIEGYQTYQTPQGDEVVQVTFDGGISGTEQRVSLQRYNSDGVTRSPTIQLNPLPNGILQAVPLDADKMQCIPLDADKAIGKDGKINFKADGTIDLETVQDKRNELRNSIGVDTVRQKNLQYYAGIAIGVVGGLSLVLLGIYVVLKFVFNSDLVKTKGKLPLYAFDLGFYILITLIFTFIGFMIGAAVVST